MTVYGNASVPQGDNEPQSDEEEFEGPPGYSPQGEIAVVANAANTLIFLTFLLGPGFFGLAQWMGYNPFTDTYGLLWIAIPFAFLLGGNPSGTYASEEIAEKRVNTKLTLAIIAFFAVFPVWLFPLFMGA